MIKLFFLTLITIPFCLLSQTNEKAIELMHDNFNKGYQQVYVNKDSTYHYLNKALKIANDIEDYDSQLGILDYIVASSSYHYDLKKYLQSLNQIRTLLYEEDIKTKIQDYESWLISYESNLGDYYFKTKEYATAKAIFLKIHSHFTQINKDEITNIQAQYLINTNSYLGTIYKHLEKYDLAEQYYQRNIDFIENCPVLEANAVSLVLAEQNLLGQLYTRTREFKKANYFFEKALQWEKESYKKNKMYKNHVIRTFQKLTLNLIKQDSLDKALSYLNESQQYLYENDPFSKQSHLLYADIYSKKGKEEKALNSLEIALKSFQKYRQNQPHQDVAEVYGKIAEFYLKQENFKEGLQAIVNAFNASGNKIKIAEVYENPKPKEVFSKTQLLYLLDIKLHLLVESYGASNEICIQTIADLLNTFNELKSEFESKLDKQFLAEKVYPIFGHMLSVAYTAYKEKPSSDILELALNVSEKNKDFALLEALRATQANQYANVPKYILEKEAQLRTKITHLEKEIFDATKGNSSFSEELFKVKQNYYSFLDTIQKKYPQYHQLKYGNKTLDLTMIRNKVLDDTSTLITYSLAGNNLYAIVIGTAKQDFIKLPFNATDRKSISEFYRVLSRPSIKDGVNKISTIAKDLYKKVLKEPLSGFKDENITIIPDAELHYLPFDLLQENDSFLLETKSISYGNSVTSLLELNQREGVKENKMLAYAPSFLGAVTANADRQFGKLLYNDDEVQNIEAFYNTESVFNEKATLKNFITQTSKFNIFHLASHASANDTYPDYSYLAFSEIEGTKEDHVLYVKDLYDMSLNADMVTLSACQTGIGRLQKGQGMMSLSKGFYYAGAKSLVTTLWKINDKSTVKLMGFFYEGLSKGKSKKEALRDAKLTYLETTEDELLKHPYYWAAFTVSGNVSPLQSSTSSIWWWCLGGFVCIGAFLWYRKKASI